MSNPVREYSTVRECRSNILQNLHQFLQQKIRNSQTLANGDQIERKSQGGGEWFEIQLADLDEDRWMQRYMESDAAVAQYEQLQTPEPPVSVTVDRCQMTYGIGNSGIWSTKHLFAVMGRILESTLELGASREFIRNQVSEVESALHTISSIDVSKPVVTELMLARDMDAIETVTDITIPDSRDELRRNSKEGFGDNFPPVPRSFLLNSDSISIEYSDDDICLLRGSTDTGYDASILTGVDDGGAFYHPMPRSLRIDNPEYDLQQNDIQELMAYDEDWSKGDELESGKWLRIQGDLLLKKVPREKIIENYQQVSLCKFVDDPITEEFLKSTDLWPLDGQIKFKVVEPATLPKITVSYPSGPARRTIEQDIRRIMDWSDDTDPGYRLVDDLIDWILERYDISSEAETQYKNELAEAKQSNLATRLDNHLVMLENTSPEPESQAVFEDFMDDDRQFTYFGVEDEGSVNIQHNEHNPVPINLDEGGYLLTLARRRNR